MPSLWTVCRLHSAIAALTLSFVSLPTLTYAQAKVTGSASEIVGSRTASATTNNAGPSGIIPFAPGFNASLGTTSQYDSSNGWATVLTPDVAFRFSPILSVNASVPIYASINVEANTKLTISTVADHLRQAISIDRSSTSVSGIWRANMTIGIINELPARR